MNVVSIRNFFEPKWAIFYNFGPKMAKTAFFWENPKMSLPYPYDATLCKKPEKTYERILGSKMYERTKERTEANLKVPTSGGGPKIK